PLPLDRGEERPVELAGRALETRRRKLDARDDEGAGSPALHPRVRIAGGRYDPADPGPDDRVHAGRRAPHVIARLEGHVEGGAACPLARLGERGDLRVSRARALVEALG